MLSSAYIYQSAKIRALEPSILDDTDIERMVDAPDLPTAFKVLNDTDYGDNLLEVEPLDYRVALSDDYMQLFNLMKSIIPDSNLFKFIFLDRDLVNIKLLFKAKQFSAEVDNILKENCINSPEVLKEYILNGKDAGLDKDIKNLIDQSNKELTEDSSPSMIDTILTKQYFSLMSDLAQRINSSLINNYSKILINNANLLTFLRAKRLGLEKNETADRLIKGGSIDSSNLLHLYNEEAKALRPIIAVYYDQLVLEAFDKFTEDDLLFSLEKALEDFKTRHLAKAKMVAYGPEVILAYHLAKQNAVANIRIIMTGKLNQIPAEEIKKTLREVR